MTKERSRRRSKPAMPNRPRQHELDTEAVRHIKNMLPSGWTDQEPKVGTDYGKDILWEIFENQEATGLEFRVQSKGHEKFSVVNTNQIAEDLKVATLNYFESLVLPVMLVIYSAEENRACYLWIKSFLREVLDKKQPDWRTKEGNSEIRIHVPLSKVLDQTTHHEIFNYVDTERAKASLREITTSDSNSHNKSFKSLLPSSTRVIHPKIEGCLHRERLTSIITNAQEKSSIFLQADAGFGKTWLIQDFISTTNLKNFIWYTFTDEKIHPLQFLEELAKEIFRQTNGEIFSSLDFLHSKEIDPNQVITILLHEIQSWKLSITIILEDLHYIGEEIGALLVDFIKHCPSNLKIILTSRISPPFNEAKLIAQNSLTVLDRLEIAFQPDETREYTTSILHIKLSEQQINLLHERTDGWIAAVGLAVEAFRGTSSDGIDELFKRLSGFDGNIYTFFAQEVYEALPLENKILLKRLGIAKSLHPEVVNLFTKRNDGGLILKEFTRANLFLIEEDTKTNSYRIHSLFAQFLEARLCDEEGDATLKDTHRTLAHFYAAKRQWVPATEHAIEGSEWKLAIEGLEMITPTAMNMGYGLLVLENTEKIPVELLNQSAIIQETIGRAALQIGELERAIVSLEIAKSLYQSQEEKSAMLRLQYLVNEINLNKGEMSAEDFVHQANRIANEAYEHNDTLLGVQVEIRMIEIGQTISVHYQGLLRQLIERIDPLVSRIQQLGNNYSSIKARALAIKAHLLFQFVDFTFRNSATKVRMRESMNKPVPMDDRVANARFIIQGFHHVLELYDEAEKLTKDENEIEWALIRSQHMRVYAHRLSMVHLLITETTTSQAVKSLKRFTEDQERTFRMCLYVLQECAAIFGKYQMIHPLVKTYCDIADILDILEDFENRNKYAQEALNLASQKNLVNIIERSQDILNNKSTYSSLLETMKESDKDKNLASYDKKRKAHYVESVLESFAGEIDIEEIREAVTTGVEDMVAVAKQRTEWCKYVQIIEDKSHEKSLETFYREVPKKWIVCTELKHRSIYHGYSFEELWPLFRGGYCLGCLSRKLAE